MQRLVDLGALPVAIWVSVRIVVPKRSEVACAWHTGLGGAQNVEGAGAALGLVGSCDILCYVANCQFQRNLVTSGNGGAVFAQSPANLTLFNNVFNSNSASESCIMLCTAAVLNRSPAEDDRCRMTEVAALGQVVGLHNLESCRPPTVSLILQSMPVEQ